MKSAVAILTYNRVHALETTLKSFVQHCPGYPIAVFDDGSINDGTEEYLTQGRERVPQDALERSIEAVRWTKPDEPYEVYMGTRNLGVSGGTNRALRWFTERGYDHLCLCNDDLIATGDFVQFYGKAHVDTEIGFFCFSDFTGETYRWMSVPYRGYKVKLLPRMTGIMLSFPKQLVQAIGYFDMRFGRWGEEHCSYTNRARIAGYLNMDKQPQHCLDLEHNLLAHQEVESSVFGQKKAEADAAAAARIALEPTILRTEGIYMPFHTEWPKYTNGRDGGGIKFERLKDHYTLVTDRV